MNTVALYATDTMADWEYGHAVAGINQAIGAGAPIKLVVAGESGSDVTTAGGITIRPDVATADLEPSQLLMLILPGGYTWAEGHHPVLSLAERLLGSGGSVAAICGATVGLARTGILDDRKHTSNTPEFLAATGYGGAEHYVTAREVTDGHVTTSPGAAPVDFARAIFSTLDLFTEDYRAKWHRAYTTADPADFDALMAAQTR